MKFLTNLSTVSLLLGFTWILCPSVNAQSGAAPMPNSILICAEGCTITAVSNPAAVFQYGAGTGSTWLAPITPITLPFDVSGHTLPDPNPGVGKGLNAQQMATSYTVTWTAGGPGNVMTIPALVVTTPASPSIVILAPVAPSTVYSLTFSDWGFVPGISNSTFSLSCVVPTVTSN